MKKLCFALALFLSVFTLSAQDDMEKKGSKSESGEIQTVFANVKKISGFGAFDLEYASIDGELGVFTGGSGGITLGNIIVGGYGMGLSTSTRVNYNTGRGLLTFGHGGLLLGFEMMPKKLIHFTAGTKLGWGGVGVGDTNSIFDTDNWSDGQTESVFVIQPMAGIEVNMTKFFKIGISGQYRLVQGADDLDGFDGKKLNGASVGVSLKFGWFK